MTQPQRQWLSADNSRAAVQQIAGRQRGVVARRQLTEASVPRWYVRRELKAGRWQRTGQQTVATFTGELTDAVRRQVAVLEAGPRAALAGLSALQESQLKVDYSTIHVALPRGGSPRVRRQQLPRRPAYTPGVRLHETRRFREEDVLVNLHPRRFRAPVATVQAALWADSDRQAQLWMIMAVQQGLATPKQLSDALSAIRRHRRRALLLTLVEDLSGGVRSLNELDVAADFRRRGFPEPQRQEVRSRASGVQYLDVSLPAYRLVFEIDGMGHDEIGQRVSDVLRDLDISADGDTILRLPIAVYRLERERILDRIERLLRARGWTPPLRQAG